MRALVVTALVASVVPAAAGSAGTTALRGHVTIGPLTPVCRVGTPCSGSAKHVTLSFRRQSRVRQTTTDASGNYRIVLAPGIYRLSANKGMSIRPVTVTALADRIRTVNLAIDTGIR